MAVDREFACILFMCIYFFALLVSFGCLWCLFCRPWTTLGAFGAPWATKGLSWASLWRPWGTLGTPWGHLGHLGLPRGAWDDLGSKMDVQFRANVSQVRSLRTKSDLAELSGFSPPQPPQRRIHAKCSKSRSSQPHFACAGGKDDVSLDKLPQIKP